MPATPVPAPARPAATADTAAATPWLLPAERARNARPAPQHPVAARARAVPRARAVRHRAAAPAATRSVASCAVPAPPAAPAARHRAARRASLPAASAGSPHRGASSHRVRVRTVLRVCPAVERVGLSRGRPVSTLWPTQEKRAGDGCSAPESGGAAPWRRRISGVSHLLSGSSVTSASGVDRQVAGRTASVDEAATSGAGQRYSEPRC